MSRTFERFAGACAVLVALGGVGYGIAFVFTVRSAPRGATMPVTYSCWEAVSSRRW